MRVVILVILIIAFVVAFDAADGDAQRIALLPIRVSNLSAETCWILPGQMYMIGDPMLNAERHPESTWVNVQSARCSGVAQVGR